MKKMLMAVGLFAALMATACSSENDAREALAGAGYTDITITGYSFFGCSDDTFHTGFLAKGPSGVQVKGVVCSGFLKGSTIRTF